MEIEKKYLVEKLPEDLSVYEKWEIEQCYLCADPAIRIRKRNGDYILTYKNRHTVHDKREQDKVNASDELEAPLTGEAYHHLKKKADGICIKKTRYRIPYKEYMIELDVFHEEYAGFYLAEVEFATVPEAKAFVPPDWFGRDVSGDYHYTNSYMSAASPK